MKAVDKSLKSLGGSQATDDDKYFYEALKSNCFKFSSAKNYQEVLSLSQALVGENGRRSFDEFKAEASKICDTFRGDYMRTEYEQALITSTRIADYRRHSSNADAYPTLQYMTRADGHVREAHEMLHGLKLAADDPAVDSIYPPNGWRCRCRMKPISDDAPSHQKGVEAIRALQAASDDKGVSEWDRMVKGGFNTNPGRTGVIFPPQHPYWEGVPESILAK